MRIDRTLTALATAAALLLLAACSAPPSTSPASARPTAEIERGIAYRSIGGQDLALDACLPGGGREGPPAGSPAIVLIHGGAFREGDRTTMSEACTRFAEAGYAGFAVDYRLLPSSYPAQVEDTAAAVAWLREPAQIERFGIDPDAVSVLGSSAGGIIALSAAAALSEAGAPVQSVVTLSAAGDLTPGALTLGTPGPELQAVVLAYLGCPAIEACPNAVAGSPITHAAALPPTLMFASTDEIIPVEQAQALHDAMQDAGVDSELVTVEGPRHGLQLLSPSANRTIVEFLDSHASSR